jgi:hypothetical protein
LGQRSVLKELSIRYSWRSVDGHAISSSCSQRWHQPDDRPGCDVARGAAPTHKRSPGACSTSRHCCAHRLRIRSQLRAGYHQAALHDAGVRHGAEQPCQRLRAPLPRGSSPASRHDRWAGSPPARRRWRPSRRRRIGPVAWVPVPLVVLRSVQPWLRQHIPGRLAFPRARPINPGGFAVGASAGEGSRVDWVWCDRRAVVMTP